MSEPTVVSRNGDGSPKVWFFTNLDSFLNAKPLEPRESLPAVVRVDSRPPSIVSGGSAETEPEVSPPSSQVSESQPPSVAEFFAELAKIRECPHWSKPSCGCQWGICAVGKGKKGVVNVDECRECLKSSL